MQLKRTCTPVEVRRAVPVVFEIYGHRGGFKGQTNYFLILSRAPPKISHTVF